MSQIPKINCSWKPTKKDIKHRHKELEKRGHTILHMDKVRDMCRGILSSKNKTDICLSYVKHVADFTVMNKDEMKVQMKRWKELIKDGKITILEGNNNEFDIDTKKVYTFVITPVDFETSFCPVALAWGTLVSGYTYVFTKKDNRDSIFAYLKKYCDEMEQKE
tara:strand:+ start:341 stop:829 length:489 start_codon:yes stop_codon:yes gene_type:complete